MKRLIALITLFLGLMAIIIIDTGISGLVAFVNAPSLLLIFIILFSVLVLTDSFTDFKRGFKIMLGFDTYTTKELKASKLAYDLAIKLVTLSAIIGGITGIVMMLGSLDDPSRIGPTLAVILLVTFYAAIINLFFYGIRSKIQKEIIYRK